MPMLAQVPTEVLRLWAGTVVKEGEGGVNLPCPEGARHFGDKY